jgi:iron-sulfur cluster repair protein YtfE (RIC family)
MAVHVSSCPVYEQALQEHEFLREQLKFLHHQLELQQVPLAEIERLLSELRGHLEAHFHSEEREGFFDQVLTCAPQHSRRVGNLTQEHVELLGGLDSLIGLAGCGAGQPQYWRVLALRFEDFMRKLMHHESEENDVLQQAYQDDLGTKD